MPSHSTGWSGVTYLKCYLTFVLALILKMDSDTLFRSLRGSFNSLFNICSLHPLQSYTSGLPSVTSAFLSWPWNPLQLQSHHSISGLKTYDTEHRIMIYADDALLLLTDLKNSILTLLRLINTFYEFSGFRGNKSKSFMMFLTK